jgi:hypothetical protein
MPEFTFSEMEDDPRIVMGMMHATDGHMGGRKAKLVHIKVREGQACV